MFDFGERMQKAAIKSLIPTVRENKDKVSDVVKKIIDEQDLQTGEVEAGVLFMRNNSDTINASLVAFDDNNTVVRIIESKELSELLIEMVEGLMSKK